MTKRYLGNIITQNPTAPAGPFENDAAPGVWSLAEAFAYSKAGLWPTAGNAAPTWYGNRALMAGGFSGSYYNSIDYITITSAGNASDFGDLTMTSRSPESAVSNASRGVFINLYNLPNTNRIDYVTIATTGNAADFGDAYYTTVNIMAVSDGTKGFVLGGNSLTTEQIDISTITIASTGNAVDWGGDASVTGRRAGGATGSSTRGLFIGGVSSLGTYGNLITYMTFATVGDTVDFGDLGTAVYYNNSTGSDVRALSMGGYNSSNDEITTMEYVTIATTGNATSFGDLARGTVLAGATSNNVTGIYAGGYDGASMRNEIQEFTIATTGNATDFGDLTAARSGCATTSGN
jgi:hypothetical protein